MTKKIPLLAMAMTMGFGPTLNPIDDAAPTLSFVFGSRTTYSRDFGYSDISKIHQEKVDIYQVYKNNVTVTAGKYEKTYNKGQYVISRSDEIAVPDQMSSISGDMKSNLFKVPEQFKQNFKIAIRSIFNNRPISLYLSPHNHTKLSTRITLPEYVYATDMCIYNGHFLKININGSDFYVNTNSIDCVGVTNEKFAVVGLQEEKEMVHSKKSIRLDVQHRSFLTEEEIHHLIEGSGLEGIEKAVLEIEEKYGINALFTIALAAHESGWGSSYFARVRNNLFGICAFDSNVDAASDYQSKTECVKYWGKLIYEEYFMNGRTDIYSINDIYASDSGWSSKVTSIMYSLGNEAIRHEKEMLGYK